MDARRDRAAVLIATAYSTYDTVRIRGCSGRRVRNVDEDEGGSWRAQPVCSQRVQNFGKAETSKHSTTKRKPTSHTLSVLAWLWTAPEPGQRAPDRARASFMASFPHAFPSRLPTFRATAAPCLAPPCVCVRWGGDPSSVVNIYNPNYSSHPTQQQRHAVGRPPSPFRLQEAHRPQLTSFQFM